MNEHPAPSAAEIRDAIRHLLPHGSFDLTVVYGHGIPGINASTRDGRDALVIRCRCGRRLDWPTGPGDTLPMDVLLWWLIDHDDEMFLTPRELEARHAATLKPTQGPLDLFGLPLAAAAPNYRAVRRKQHPKGGDTARPACAGCDLPETNCACG